MLSLETFFRAELFSLRFACALSSIRFLKHAFKYEKAAAANLFEHIHKATF